MTSILCLGEVIAVSIIWWSFQERDWKKYILITLLPVAVSLFYYAHAPRYQFFFGLSPEQLIRDNISRQRFEALFIFMIALAVYGAGRKIRAIKSIPDKEILRPVPYVFFMAMVLAFSAAVLCIFALHAKKGVGFPVTSRYFIYLTPIGVMATTILTVSLVRSLSANVLIKWACVGIIGVLFAQYFLKIVPRAIHSLAGG
jgi:hypothetical protein